MWVCRLLYLCSGNKRLLDAQLTQPPDAINAFEWGQRPLPGTLNWAPPVFDRTLDLGTDPDTECFSEPNSEGTYNLFERVSAHIPSTADWLFKLIWPYFYTSLPPVSYASFVVDRCLRRAGLRRLRDNTLEFARAARRERTTDISESTLRSLTEEPGPLHLMLLMALYHERQWHQANSTAADAIGHAFVAAYARFLKRPEFECTPEAIRASRENQIFFSHVYQAIKHRGHRSESPRDLAWTCVKEASLIFCEDYPGFDEADLCVSLGVATPLWYFAATPNSQYWKGSQPTRDESLQALDEVLLKATCDPRRWANYESESPSIERAAVDAFFVRDRALRKNLQYPCGDEILRSIFTPPQSFRGRNH